jgi:hypothetical protein
VKLCFEPVLSIRVIFPACQFFLLSRAMKLLAVACVCLFSAAVLSEASTASEESASDYSLQKMTAMDKTQYMVSENIDGFAQWIDSFFDDGRIIEEDASTRLRVSQGVFFEKGEQARLKARINVKFDVPRFKNRLKLFVSDEDVNEEKTVTAANKTFNEIDEDVQIGLQYFAKSSDKRNISLSTGIKLESLEVFAGPRYRRTFRLDGWQLRFTQRIRWYTSMGWESTTRFDLEKLLSDKILFRNIIKGRWREEDEGYRYEISPTLVQALEGDKGLEYQWGNFFRTRPVHRFEESVLRVRYRQRFWRKWLFYEVAPQVAFRNDDDFEATPGINLLLEVVFGGNGHHR